MTDLPTLPQLVASTADRAGLHAPAPAMLLELQSLVGWLSGLASESTERGRRPFRVGQSWDSALGAVGFALYNLADQTGVDLASAVARHAHQLSAALDSAPAHRSKHDASWPFGES